MRNRIIVHLAPGEREALQAMSEQDTRPPAAQIRHLLLTEAAKRGISISSIDPVNANTYSAKTLDGRRVVGVEA